MTAHQQLSAADAEVLAFERATWRLSRGAKDTAILDRFGDLPARYYQRLNRIRTLPAAQAYDPDLVARLTRIADGRAAQRTRKAATR